MDIKEEFKDEIENIEESYEVLKIRSKALKEELDKTKMAVEAYQRRVAYLSARLCEKLKEEMK